MAKDETREGRNTALGVEYLKILKKKKKLAFFFIIISSSNFSTNPKFLPLLQNYLKADNLNQIPLKNEHIIKNLKFSELYNLK